MTQRCLVLPGVLAANESAIFAPVAVSKDNPYGQRFEISAPLATPSGRRIAIQSVWQIDKAADLPRLITLFPR